MSFLRRAAVRTLLAQPSRHLATQSVFTSRVTSAVPSRICAIRALHQSRLLRAEEEKKPEEEDEEARPVEASTTDETVTDETVTDETITAEPYAQDEAINSDVEEPNKPVITDIPSVPQTSVPETAAPDKKVVYVGNLSFDVTLEMLEREFSKAGEVVKCRLATDARGLSRGFGHIEFATIDQAELAVQAMNNVVYEGRKMLVQPHMPRTPRTQSSPRDKGPKSQPPGSKSQPPGSNSQPPSRTLFIGNISYDMSDKDMNDLFRTIRNVVDIRVAIDRRSGQPRGFAHADFIDIPSAQRAKEDLERKIIYGRQLRVDWGTESVGFDGRTSNDKYRNNDRSRNNDKYRNRGRTENSLLAGSRFDSNRTPRRSSREDRE